MSKNGFDAATVFAERPAPRKFEPELAKQRRTERTRRVATAQGRAKTALTRYFKTEYRALYRLALDEVYAERGPLPGDKS